MASEGAAVANSGGSSTVPKVKSPDKAAASFQCTLCDKSFNRTENLSRHMKTHAAIKRHVCSVCGKGFTRSDLLKRHEGVHRRDPGSVQQEEEPKKRRKVEQQVYPSRNIQSATAMAPDNSFVENIDPALNALLPPNSVHITNGLSDYGFIPPTPESQEWRHVTQLTPDYSSFLSVDFDTTGMMDNWFTGEFYSALQETGTEWMYVDYNQQPTGAAIMPPQAAATAEEIVLEGIHRERTSRVASPLNEASEDDKWPFAWNPRSVPVFNAKPIVISRELFEQHNPEFDVTDITYHRFLRHFEHFRQTYEPPFHNHVYTIPNHQEANILIGIFFKHFYPQLPVLHLPTFNINDGSVSTELIAMMIVIGSIYSLQRNSRRFAIVFLDSARRSLLTSVEHDNGLLRDPLWIYTMLLVSYTGVWCGNKRAFEFGEAMRGSVVTHCRRLGFGRCSLDDNSQRKDPDTRWKAWIRMETQKRLCWAVYMLDSQFPGLLNLPATMSSSEVSDLELPCDEEFWVARTATYWTRLVGSMIQPLSRSFASAMGPFLVPFLAGNCGQDTIDRSKTQHLPLHEGLPIMALNSWSRMLVLLAIHVQIYEYSQDMIVARNICGDAAHQMFGEEEYTDPALRKTSKTLPKSDLLHFDPRIEGPDAFQGSSAEEIRLRSRGSIDTINWSVWDRLASRKDQLCASLRGWSDAYLRIPSSDLPTSSSSRYFYECAKQLYQLGRIEAELPLTEAQNAIGKLGPEGIPRAMSNLSLWARSSPQKIIRAAYISVKLITSLFPAKQQIQGGSAVMDTGPYGIITCFLCHVNLWCFVVSSSRSQKIELLRLAQEDDEIRSGPFFPVIQKVLQHASDGAATKGKPEDSAKLVFKSAANVMTRLGTWGAALNMALLLHSRAEM